MIIKDRIQENFPLLKTKENLGLRMQYKHIHHIPGRINRDRLRSRHAMTNILVYNDKVNVLKALTQEENTDYLQQAKSGWPKTYTELYFF